MGVAFNHVIVHTLLADHEQTAFRRMDIETPRHIYPIIFCGRDHRVCQATTYSDAHLVIQYLISL